MKSVSRKPLDKGKIKKKGKEKDEPQPGDMVPPPPPMPGDEMFALPTREVVKPENQLQLSEAELNEEIAKMLTANNAEAPKNIARFNMKERCYKFEPMVEQTITHYATDGWLLYKSSEEAKKQMDMEKMEQEAMARFQAELERAMHEKGGDGEVEPPDDSRQLRNQFNFSERAAQTLNYPMRDRETFTEPPPTATISGVCTQWDIYDEYIKDFERQRIDDLAKQKGGKKQSASSGQAQKSGTYEDSPEFSRCLRILDRMVNQNMYEEIAMDFKYWDDASDAFRQGEGTLLPLWRFQPGQAKRKQVTSICWNPQYLDMFAVGYGSFEFQKQSSGLICIFSLKNPTHPEFSLTTESGVMCVHFHPEFANLLAVGCYDGSVVVFDVRQGTNEPIYQANVRTGKHNDPVWQVFWQVDELQKALQIVSISSDGYVLLWTLNKSELTHEVIMKLKMDKSETGGVVAAMPEAEEDTHVAGTAGGCCMDFSKGQDHIYLVGTEEGSIHKCSKAYSSEYLSTYQGHYLAVYAVKWNYLHHRMFLSASADWTVKLWDSTQVKKPVMSFDLNCSVGDVSWAPYSATVFAAVTDDGRVHVFDLFENKLLPLCSQKIVKKSKLTKLVFNPVHPIVLVGDDKGCVTSLKLSPNLRRASKPEKGQKFEELEISKLDHVIEIARKSEATNS